MSYFSHCFNSSHFNCGQVPQHSTHACAAACSFPPHVALQSAGQLPEAFVVLGFAFYLQPMMMPLLHDMPPGATGLAITSTAVKIVILGMFSFKRTSCVALQECTSGNIIRASCLLLCPPDSMCRTYCSLLQNVCDASLRCPLVTYEQANFTVALCAGGVCVR